MVRSSANAIVVDSRIAMPVCSFPCAPQIPIQKLAGTANINLAGLGGAKINHYGYTRRVSR
eukprot:5054394-Lingulodinium_polyedra.AAC.1